MSLARLYIVLGLDSSGFQQGMMAAIQQVQALQRSVAGLSAGQSLSGIGRGLTTALTIPIIAAAAAIATFGSGLDAQLARVQSVIATPGNSGIDQIMAWRPQIQQLGIDMGRSSEEVAGGMYEIVSALGPISNAMDYLRITSKGAVAGQSDIVTSTKNMTLATRAWGDNSTAMVQKMTDLASQTVKVGTLTESELGPALAKMLPISKAYGVTLNDSFASLSALSGVTGNASEVATQFTRATLSLVAPNTALTKAYKNMGVESGEAMIAQYGLQGALQKVADYSEKTGVPLLKLLGRSEALKFSIGILGEQAGAFATQSRDLADAAGAVDTAFDATTNGIDKAAFQWAQAGQRLRVIAEDLYLAFATVSLKVIDSLSPLYNNLRDLSDQILAMPTEQLTQIAYGLLGLAALGPVLTILGNLTTLFGGLTTVIMAVNPWIWAAVAAGGALWAAWNNDWGGIREGVYGLMDTIKQRADNARQAIENLQTAWQKFNNPTGGESGSTGGGAVGTLRNVAQAAGEAWRALGPARSELSHFEQGIIDQAPKARSAWDLFVGGFKNSLPTFQEGGGIIRAVVNSLTTTWDIMAAGADVAFAAVVKGLWATVKAIATFGSSLSAGFLVAISAARSAASSIMGAFKLNWGSIGSNIASGIASGIRAGVGAITSAATSAASAALSAAKSALGIKSPSSVFRDQVGRMIPAGVAVGINANAYMVQGALNSLLLLGGGSYNGVSTYGGHAMQMGIASGIRAGGGSTTTNETTINVYVSAAPGATQQDGEAIGNGITDALRRRGLL